ncbi:hypothetical protein AS850_03980 [Frondihabitans sp. 762G35]|uniref:DUF4245 domain-containing protein n=1 Tax=Frondihabitans sp. 762G35 TaxID=1446794 RepID=UPI000D214F9E|nr:DUF4245 domain-containing protein [Frondihabitans sp. 762G35]ARC56233.1 hypothetical protein AS850_03980 [Frondihabitans sp. 762G35]
MTSVPPPPPPIGRQRPPRVVAELGRPETPEETAARKAASSRAHRVNQTTRNLLLSIGASVGIVLVLVLAVVRPNESQITPTDYRQVAASAQQQVTPTLAAPSLPSGWSSNSAEIRPAGSDGVQSWYVGFLTPDTQFIGLTQGLDANQTWLSNTLEKGVATSSTSVGGVTWKVYDRRSDTNAGNLAYSMSAVIDRSTVVLSGTATDAQFDLLAQRVAEQLTR